MRPHADALFHDRDAMEEAVRDLVQEGVPRQRIRVSQALETSAGIRTAPKQITGAGVGALIGAVIGVAVLLALTPALTAVESWLALAPRILGAAAAGALTGAVLALVAYRPPRARYEAYRDFFVHVDADDANAATRIRRALSRSGGQLVGA